MLSREQIGLEKLNHGCRELSEQELGPPVENNSCLLKFLEEKARVDAVQTRPKSILIQRCTHLAIGQLAPIMAGLNQNYTPRKAASTDKKPGF